MPRPTHFYNVGRFPHPARIYNFLIVTSSPPTQQNVSVPSNLKEGRGWGRTGVRFSFPICFQAAKIPCWKSTDGLWQICTLKKELAEQTFEELKSYVESVLLEGHPIEIQIARTLMEEPGYNAVSSFSGIPDRQVSGKTAGIFSKQRSPYHIISIGRNSLQQS